MTGWDGKGIDPWLPERLAAELAITKAERRMYQEWWGSFSAWLVTVHRSVLGSNTRPDASAVWAHAPLWAEKMTTFVQGPVRDTMGLAYGALFGKGYQFDARPAVSAYLGQVHNRMVRTTDEVYDLVASRVARGAARGDSIPDIAASVDEILTATKTERWASRAVTVARTETIGSLNFGRADGFAAIQEELGEPLEHQWLSSADARVRDSHVQADGQRVPVGQPFTVGGALLDHPGDPFGPPEETINCVIGETAVEYPGLRAATRRWYEGDVIKLSFASGDQLTVTPNHPVLRADGRWTPAGLLNEGDHCVRSRGLDRAAGTPDQDGRPAQIAEVYRAAHLSGHAERVRHAPPDFHGDGRHGEVEVVAVQRELGGDRQAATDEQVEEFGLALADVARASMGRGQRSRMSLCRADGDVGRDVPSPATPVGARGQSLPLLVGHRGHADQIGLAASPGRDAHCLQPPQEGRPADAQFARHGEDALSPVIAGAQVGLLNRYASGKAAGFLDGAERYAGIMEEPGHGRDRDAESPGQCGRGLALLVAPDQRRNIDGEAVPGTDSVAVRPDRDTCRAQVLYDRGGGDDERRSDGGGGFPRFVSTTEVVEVKRVVAFTGHVYNLDSGDGWYTANSIVCRNCRCTTLLVGPDEQVDMTGRGFLDVDDWWASEEAA